MGADAVLPAAEKTVALAPFSTEAMSVLVGREVQDFGFPADYPERLKAAIAAKLAGEPGLRVATLSNGANASPSDYISGGDIELLEIDRRVRKLPGGTQTQLVAHMTISQRIKEGASGRVVYARRFDEVFTAAHGRGRSASVPDFVAELTADAALRLAGAIAETVAPVSVVEVHGDKIYLDRGRDYFHEGDLLEIICRAEALCDKDGNVISIVENYAGRARVESVSEKVSTAVILDPARLIQTGWLVRRLNPPASPLK